MRPGVPAGCPRSIKCWAWMFVERLDHRVPELSLHPPALRQSVLDALDAAVALRVVVASVHDDQLVGHAPSNKPAGRSGMFFRGMVTMARSRPRAASFTVTAVAPVSAAKPASDSGPRELATATLCPSVVRRRVRVPPMLPAR